MTAQIFLSYAKEDEVHVEHLYQKLSNAGFRPWMSNKDILPGERWKSSIQRAIQNSDFFLACLSNTSVSKRGYLRTEIREALEILQEKLGNDIYLIPVLLEDCEVPEDLSDFQWVNLFESNGWNRLTEAIQAGISRRGIQVTQRRIPDLKPNEKKTCRVIILLEGDIQDFTPAEQENFVFSLSQMIDIKPESVQVLHISPGSIRVTLEMPEEAAKQLVQMSSSDDPDLRILRISSIKLRELASPIEHLQLVFGETSAVGNEQQHISILKQGVMVWNRWRKDNVGIQPNLRGVELSNMDLKGANLFQANLSRADLFRADLTGTKLSWANLTDADLSWANLSGANMSRSDFTGANLFGATIYNSSLIRARLFQTDLSRVNFNRVDLSQANLGESIVGWTTFGDVDLSTVRGLDTVKHARPSNIDIHTLNRSKGKIPESFLRGAGVPEVFITYIAALTAEAIQYYSCFISYSSKDEAFAQRLYADLQQKGVRCWFAPEDMKIGDKIRPAIDQSIRVHDKLLLVLSENSLNSAWVDSEVENAIGEENKRNSTVLFPIRLDKAVMETNQPWAGKLRRTRHIGDFSRWKDHDAYHAAFERLLRDLKAE